MFGASSELASVMEFGFNSVLLLVSLVNMPCVIEQHIITHLISIGCRLVVCFDAKSDL